MIALSNAQAWNPETDEYISIHKVEYDVKEELGEYPVRFTAAGGTTIERTIYVVNQPFVKNEKANEAVMAFNFARTVDEIQESQALDTDIKTWANAQGWKLSDENQSVDVSVDYDFDPETYPGRQLSDYLLDYRTGVQDSHHRLFGSRSGGRPDILPGRYSCYGEDAVLNEEIFTACSPVHCMGGTDAGSADASDCDVLLLQSRATALCPLNLPWIITSNFLPTRIS